MIRNLMESYRNGNSELELITAFLKSYAQFRPLKQIELDHLPNAVRFRNYDLAGFFSTFEDDINQFDTTEYREINRMVDKRLGEIVTKL
jgi:Ser/Thr protein kinase RdoA (MazF antagonist)